MTDSPREEPRPDRLPPKLNMFGLTPCPKCGSEFRVPETAEMHNGVAMDCCDDCGFMEKSADD